MTSLSSEFEPCD